MFWRNNSKTLPLLTPSLLLAGTAIYITGKPKNPDDSNSVISYFRRSCNVFFSYVAKKREIPVLPKQDAIKPVIIFDVNDFLVKKKFSFITNNYYKRPYTNVFLFHLAHLYELILISEMNASESNNLLQKIDPFGCISYRLFLNNKNEFTSKNLNRDTKTTMYIETEVSKNKQINDQINHKINEQQVVNRNAKASSKNNVTDDPFLKLSEFNKINIDKWNGKKDDKLLILLDFFVKLKHSNMNDYKKIANLYKNKEFTNAYNKQQKEKYRKSHIFVWNVNESYKKSKAKLNEERIKDFERAKGGLGSQPPSGDSWATLD
ncbi:Mitochondrial import inner membrane translocase subunit TIM50 [Binucleata daphniae]